MLAIAVLIGLVLWLLITLIATLVGAKMGKGLYKDNPKARLYGALTGFMLTMGAPISYWVIEYVYIQAKVSQLCESEGGITVYVTPEEWREQIGEEEWRKLQPLTDIEIDNSSPKFKDILLDGKVYKYTKGIYRSGNLENSKLATYRFYSRLNNHINNHSYIIATKETGIVILKNIDFSVIKNTQSFKYWMSNIKDCSDKNSTKFHTLAMQYSNYFINRNANHE